MRNIRIFRKGLIMSEYKTQQRKQIYLFLKKHVDQQFTADDIASSIDGVSLSSVYRNLDKMLSDKLIQRFQKDKSRKFVYQYMGHSDCCTCLHLKCNHCGKIVHMDTELVDELLLQTKMKNNFYIDINQTVLSGYCESCQLSLYS